MNNEVLEKLRYPIGKYKPASEITKELIEKWILTIEKLPVKLRNLVNGLSDEQLDPLTGRVVGKFAR